MSWLSPVSWAKWTWTAVRGGEGEEDEEGLEASEKREECGERGEEEEERSQGCSSDSEGHFDTPEAATPVRAPPTFPGELENNNADPDKTDVDVEEHLIVTAPVGDQDILLSLNMGQDDPATPMGGPVQLNIQTIEEEQTETFSEAQGPAPVSAPSPVKEILECAEPEPSPEPDSIEPPEPVLDLSPSPAPAPAPAPAPTPSAEQDSVQITEQVADPAVEPTEQKPVAEPELESECTALIQDVPTQKTKTRKSKPPSLKVKASLDDITQTNREEEQELPVPMATYKFDPDQVDDSFNPFTCGGSKLQNSPPPCGTSLQPRLEPLGASLPDCEAGVPPPVETDTMESSTKAKPVVLEFGLDEGKVGKPPPRKLGGKKTLKLTAKKQKPKGSEASTKPAPEPTESETDSQPLSETDSQPASEPLLQPAPEPVSDPLPETALPASDSPAPVNLDDIPIPKAGSYNFDPSQWDDPNFNPFGNNNKMSSSPVLPRGSYKFDPDNFDDSIDPFKSSKTLSTEDSADGAPQPEKEKVKVGGRQKTGLPAGEKKVRQIPKKSKESTITSRTSDQAKFLCFLLNSCKAQKYDESQSLGNDACSQEEDEVVVQTPEITQQVQHATDEEKLASTAIIGQTSDGLEEKESECSKLPAKIQSIKSAFSVNAPETKPVERDTCSLKDDITPTTMSGKALDIIPFSHDSVPQTEMDKAAVLTAIREEIITKEIEVNEWKRKYEESRAEVLAMREIVAEYEKTIAQMIEDEHQQKMFSSTKTVKQLTSERDTIMSDLDSMERSFAELFKRYEHMKGVLEDFRKNEEVLKKCAQDYLMRIKREEQRYQNLKAHAEEKLDKANEKIAHIRSEATAEGVALNARLRKEQMKVESLERAVAQKDEEIEELSKICDELIAKIGTK